MARSNGIEYFPLEVGITDSDDKIYALMAEHGGSEEAWAVFGRYVGLLSQIYAEGWAIQLDALKTRRLTDKLGFSNRDDFVAFAETCVEVGLFDRELWERENVLTSKGIQRRYLMAKKRAKGAISGPWALLGESRAIAENLGESRAFSENSENLGQSRAISDACPKTPAKEKERKEKERKEEKSSSVESGDESDEAAPILACMQVEKKGCLYRDTAGKRHKTPMGAMCASYRAATGDSDCSAYVLGVASLCPPNCRGHPKQVSECLETVLRALERYDPARGSDPWLLTKPILEQDRRILDG